MAKKTIAELLQEANQLKIQQTELNAKMKAQKSAIATEYCDNIPEAEKQKQIAEAEKILNTAKEKSLFLKAEFKKQLKEIKNSVAFAKEILDFVNYKQKNSLPKIKNQFRIEKNFLTFNREGITEIKIDISKNDWQKNFKAELKNQGINGENRIADNIVYKATQLLATHKAE
jgi:DNA integrity scanning protein DisA with diadenylate cyclase activity